MCLLIETIKILDGSIMNARMHNERMNSSRHQLMQLTDELDIRQLIQIPDYMKEGVVRCRVVYKEKIESVVFIPYIFPNIQSLQAVYDDAISYGHKFADRLALEDLYRKRGQCDEILIIKNGFVTDASIANIVFSDGINWYTPSAPLLQGTKRNYLVEKGMLKVVDIRTEDIKKYKTAFLINAMLDPGDTKPFPVSNIRL
jgi:4-amino-4-deoxychorismate lyase